MNLAASIPQPDRAKDNSPPIHRWVFGRDMMSSPVGTADRIADTFSFAPGGAWGIQGHVDPAINRWAIFGCPCGTNLCCYFLDRQLAAQATAFEKEAGATLPCAQGKEKAHPRFSSLNTVAPTGGRVNSAENGWLWV